jgi:hypothetical protein
MGTIKFLYIEDEPNDFKVRSLIEKAKEHNIQITTISDPYEIIEIMGDDNILKEYDGFICDIEIWDKPREDNSRLLVAKGYDFIKKMLKYNDSIKKVFIVLTNCTSRGLPIEGGFYELLKKDIKNGLEIRNKNSVLKQDVIEAFVQYIKNLVNDKKQKPTRDDNLRKFKDYLEHIRNKSSYPLVICLFAEEKAANPSELELIINTHLEKIITSFNKICSTYPEMVTDSKKKNFRDKMKESNALDLKFGSEIRRWKAQEKISPEEINNFVRILIWRRFVGYIVKTKPPIDNKDACLFFNQDENFYKNVLHLKKHGSYTAEEDEYLNGSIE